MLKKILVVEDDESVLKLECILLTSAGYEIHAAMSGVDALGDIAHELPDLLLLDVMLPRLDGFEVCKRLKRNAKTQHIPVIFLTARNTPEDILRGMQVGGNQYITKPFKSASLMKSIHQLLIKDKSVSGEHKAFH